MTLLPVSDYLGDSAALCDAVVRLRGPALVAELGRIASAVMASPHGQFLPAGSMDAAASSAIFSSDTPALLQEISFDGHCFGHYSVAGRSLYNDADRRQLAWAVIRQGRFAFLTAFIAGFSRVIGETGMTLMVGGNIKGQTRVLTTAISLETLKGNFEIGVALGIVLLLAALAVNVALQALQGK